MTYLSTDILLSSGSKLVEQALGDPLVHKYTSIILAIAGAIENISGLVETILPLLGLSPTATFG